MSAREADAAVRPVPEPDDAGGPFWEACARHELIAQRCTDCAEWRFPPRPACPSCTSFAHTWERLAGTGVIWSWVVAHPPLLPAFAADAPYSVIVVELPEGIRMLGRLFDVPNEAIREGMAVRVDFEDVEDGVSIPCWRPA